MDNEFLKALIGSVAVWVETGREGTPNVCVPIDKLEGFLAHLAEVTEHRDRFAADVDELNEQVDDLKLKLQATKAIEEAALFQMRKNADRMDAAEQRLTAILEPEGE